MHCRITTLASSETTKWRRKCCHSVVELSLKFWNVTFRQRWQFPFSRMELPSSLQSHHKLSLLREICLLLSLNVEEKVKKDVFIACIALTFLHWDTPKYGPLCIQIGKLVPQAFLQEGSCKMNLNAFEFAVMLKKKASNSTIFFCIIEVSWKRNPEFPNVRA